MYLMEFVQGEEMDLEVVKYCGLSWDDGMLFIELRRKEEQFFGENENYGIVTFVDMQIFI